MNWGKPLVQPSLKPGKCCSCTALSTQNLMLVPTGPRLIDLVYVAGYLDAEGCFRFHQSPVISVSNTYPYTLMFLQTCFGGTIRDKKSKPEHRTAYEWYASGDNARNCIRMVHPFLKEKQEQASLLLQIDSYPPRSVRREKLKRLLTALKRINYTADRMSKET